jgi:hypothetical protein
MNANAFVSFFLVSALMVLTGCAGSVGVKERQTADVAEYNTTGKAVARAANDVLPDINNINTCPPGMKRVNHRASGSAASSVKVTEYGTRFTHAAEGGQSHRCE